MKAVKTMLAGAAGLAAVAAMATPASAQGYPYGGYGGQSGSGVVGAIINSVLGYGQYPYGNYGYGQGAYYQSQNLAVNQCARAAEARLNGYGYNNGYGAYGNYGGGYNQPYGGYNQPYGGYQQQYGYNGRGGRVVGISRVERKNYGYHVYGVASTGTGGGYNNGYGGYNNGYGGYNNGYNTNSYGRPDVKFDCKVRGNGVVTDVDINRNMTGYRYGYGW